MIILNIPLGFARDGEPVPVELALRELRAEGMEPLEWRLRFAPHDTHLTMVVVLEHEPSLFRLAALRHHLHRDFIACYHEERHVGECVACRQHPFREDFFVMPSGRTLAQEL